MNIKEVKDLIQEILQSDISEFELEHTGTKVRLRRGFAHSEVAYEPHSVSAPPPPIARPLPSPELAPQKAPTIETDEENGLKFITSPIVGTFYRASSPDAEPFVKVGSMVDDGTILCIVEAMKLMNEIPSDVSGEVIRVYVENSHPVEFGQRLFAIRPRQ